MRVMLAHSFYRIPGGEDRYVRQQLELLEREHDVELVAASNEALSADLGTAVRMTWSSETARRVTRRIDRFRPDVIHLHNPYPAFGPAVHIAARRTGIPLVQTVHNLRLRCPNGLMFTEGAPCRRCEGGNHLNSVVHRCFPTRSQAAAYATALWSHRFVLRLEEVVTRYIAPSDFMLTQLRRWGLADGRATVVRNFVEARHPHPPEQGSGSDGIFVGRLSHEKGLTVLLDALALEGDRPFRIVGDGPMLSELRVRASELGLERTTFLGRLDAGAVADSVARARFFVMPSECDENAPMAVLEAMAAAKPVVVSRAGGLPELVRGGSGIAFDRGDASSLAAAMGALRSDDELCSTLGRQAREFVERELSPQRHMARLDEVYRDVTGRGDSAVR